MLRELKQRLFLLIDARREYERSLANTIQLYLHPTHLLSVVTSVLYEVVAVDMACVILLHAYHSCLCHRIR